MTTYLSKWIQNGFLTSSSTYQRPSRNGNGNGDGDGRARLSNTPVQKVKNADMIKHLLVLLRRRGPGNGVKFKYVPGHSGWEGNEAADVSEGVFRAAKSTYHTISPSFFPDSAPRSWKVQTMSQCVRGGVIADFAGPRQKRRVDAMGTRSDRLVGSRPNGCSAQYRRATRGRGSRGGCGAHRCPCRLDNAETDSYRSMRAGS
jgi:hypothetical protein